MGQIHQTKSFNVVFHVQTRRFAHRASYGLAATVRKTEGGSVVARGSVATGKI
jgi:hypothetical protein